MSITSKERVAYTLLMIVIVILSVAVLAVAGYSVFDLSDTVSPPEQTTYDILIPEYIEVYSDRLQVLAPDVVSSDREYITGKFKYELVDENAGQNISISKDGSVEVLTPGFNGEVEVRIIDQNTGAEKIVKLRVVTELSGVLEIRDSNGNALSSSNTLAMEIGESYTFEVVTLPSVAAVEEFITVEGWNCYGESERVFDIRIEANRVILTAIGAGRGTAMFTIDNKDRGVHYSIDVPIDIGFPDDALTKAVVDTSDDGLLSAEEIASVERIVFDSDVKSVSMEKSDLLTGLCTTVFEADEIVSMDLSDVNNGMIFRVAGEELYLSYIESDNWRSVKDNIYPYIDDHTKPVIVLHNEATYTLNGNGLCTDGISSEESTIYDYVSDTSPRIYTLVIEDGVSIPSYTLAGFAFGGWKDQGGHTFDNEDIPSVYEGIHINALWSAKTYTVTLDGHYTNGAMNNVVSATYITGMPELPEAEKEGWTFDGWYTDTDYVNEVTEGMLYMIPDDKTLYAKFITDITLDYGGIISENVIIEDAIYGGTLGDALLLTEDDYSKFDPAWTFDSAGWNDSSLHTGKLFNSESPYLREGRNVEHTLYARFTRSVSLNTLALSETSFDSITVIGGLSLDESLIAEGRVALADFKPVLESDHSNWHFFGWTDINLGDDSLKIDLISDDVVSGDAEISTDITDLYAIYYGTVTYKYGPHFNNNLNFSKNVIFGTVFYFPEVSDSYDDEDTVNSYVGYEFAGWALMGDDWKAEKDQIPTDMIVDADTVNKTYVAKYNALPYTVTFFDDNENILSDAPYVGFVYYDVGFNINDNVWNNDEEGFPGREIQLPKTPSMTGNTGNWMWKLSDSKPGSIDADAETWTVPASVLGNLTLYADYNQNSYRISYYTHGVDENIEGKPSKVTYGTPFFDVLPMDIKVPDGYYFDGWYFEDGKNVTSKDDEYIYSSDITLYAKYCIEVTLDCGPHNKQERVFVYNATNKLDKLGDTGGWTFVGWYDENNNIMCPDEGKDGVLLDNYTSSKTLYKSCWKRELTVDVDDGFEATNTIVTVYRDNGADVPTQIENLDGWEIDSWYCDISGIGKVALDGTLIPLEIVNNTSVTTISADFKSTVTVVLDIETDSLAPKEYEVKIMLGGTLFEGLNELYATELQSFVGYKHAGWKIGDNQYTANYPTVGRSYAKATVYAKFNPVTYKVFFETNGGSKCDAMDAVFDQIHNLPSTTRPGYAFAGWYTDKEFAGEPLTEIYNLLSQDSESGGEITLYAKWEANKYTVTFDTQCDVVVENIEATYDIDFELPTLEETGYIFMGWYYNGTIFNGTVKNLTENSGTITLTPARNPIKYTVKYDTCGGDPLDDVPNIEYNEDDRFTGETARDWYIFDGWYLNPDYTGVYYAAGAEFINLTDVNGGEVTLYAKWTPRTYTITYKYSEDEEDDVVIEFDIEDESYYQPETPKIPGYTVVWDMSGLPFGDEGKEAKDYTVDFKKTEIVYTITFFADGEIVKVFTYTVDKLDLLKEGGIIPTAPDKLGYTFARWDKDESDILALKDTLGNLEVYASYVANEYTIVYNNPIGEDESVSFTLDDVTLPTPPSIERDGYRYEWNFSRDYLLSKIENGNVNITVSPTVVPIVYTVTVNNGSDNFEYSYTAELGNEIKIIAPVIDEGYEFVALNGATVSSYENGVITLIINVYEDIYVCAREINTDSYTLIFDYQIGKEYSTAAVGEGITLPTVTREGYVLDGWYLNEELVEAGRVLDVEANASVTLVAKWKPIQYTVTLDANGGTVENTVLEATYDESIELETPVRDGYTFLGWYFGDDIISTALNLTATNEKNVTLVAEWTPIIYNVVFNSDGGNVTPSNTAVKYGENITLPYGITKTGYILLGWECNGTEYKGSYASNLSTVNRDTVTLTAIWQPITYTVIFADSDLEPVVRTYDDDYLFPEAFKTGYKIINWQCNIDGVSQLFFKGDTMPNLTEIDGDTVTVTAIWDKDRYTVSFSYTTFETITIEKWDNTGFIDEYMPENYITVRDGYVAGWSSYLVIDGNYNYETELLTGKTSEGWVAIEYNYDGKTAYRIIQISEVSEPDFSSVEPSIPYVDGYKAEWKYTQDPTNAYKYIAEVIYTPENEETYTVIFDTGCSITIDPIEVAFGDNIVLEAITRIGCNFLGWRSADGQLYTVGEAINVNSEGKYAEVVLTAEWEFISYNINFVGASNEDNVTYTIKTRPGDIVVPDTVPPRVGYIGAWVIPELTYGDIDLHPVYTPITYTVKFNLGGADGEFADILVYYDSKVLLGVPEKEGSVFIGWKYNGVTYSGTEAIDMILTDTADATVELIALWENKTYTATFVNWDETVEIKFSDKDIAKGYIIAPKLCERDHYIAYWEEYILSASDITVRAIYVPIVYTIEYYIDGNPVYTVYYTKESEFIPVPDVQEKEGYHASWSDIPEEIDNKTVNAIYTAIKYTVNFDSNGGENVDSYIATYDKISLLPSPTREGYTFTGWTYEGETITSINNLSSVDGSELTLVATWQATEYKLTFADADGNVIESIEPITYTVETPIEEILAQYPDISEHIAKISGYDMKWAEIIDIKVGGMTVEPVFTETVYYVIFDYEGAKENGERTWTVSSGAITEYPANTGHVWKTRDENGSYVDYVLSADKFTLNEETGRYELVLRQVQETSTYKVLFVDGDQLIATRYYNIVEGAEIILPGVPSKTGYVDGTWDTSGIASLLGISVDENKITILSLPEGFKENYPADGVSIEAKYTAIRFTVVYDVNGGDENSAPANQEATYVGETHISDITPTRTGYKFVAWTYDGYDGKHTVIPDDYEYLKYKEHGEQLTLVAQWEPITYEIEFIVNESTYQTVTVAYDEKYFLPADTVDIEHYVFSCWKIGDKSYKPGDEILNLTEIQGTKIEAKAEYVPAEYKIVFVADGITVEEDTYTYTGQRVEIELPLLPDKAYHSGEWKINIDGEWQLFNDYELKSGDITVEAVYTPKTYTVTFLEKDKEGKDVERGTATYTYGDTEIGYPEIPSEAGYTFSWPEVLLDGGEKTVYLVKTPIVYNVFFYDKAEGEDGAVIISTSTSTVDDRGITVPPVPYGYAAWDIPTLTMGDVSVYPTAKVEDSHLVTFVDELNNVVATVIVKDGTRSDEITKPTVPERTGYTAAWSAMPEVIDEDITVRAMYEIEEYTVSFYNDRNELYYTVTYTVENTNISLPTVPAKSENAEHYDGGAWNIGKLTYGDVDVYPSYIPKIYTITFKAMTNSGEYIIVSRRTYTIENPNVSTPPIPDREGYDTELAFWSDPEGKLKALENQLCDFEIEAVYGGYYINFNLEGVVDYNDAPIEQTPIVGNISTGFDLPEPTPRKGYTFVAWSYNGEKYYVGTHYNVNLSENDNNVVMTAVWEANKYTVEFDSDGGSNVDSIEVVFDGKYDNLPTPTKPGHTFEGWYYGEAEITGASFVTITDNHELKAKWKIINYTIILRQGTGTTLTITYGGITYTANEKGSHELPYGTQYTIDASLNKGYNTLLCSTGKKILTDNCEHASSATPNTYRVEYHANKATGGSMPNSDHTYDASKKLSSNAFYKTGYTFIGWNTKTDGSGTSYSNEESVMNLTSDDGGVIYLYAQWSINYYTITVTLEEASVTVNGVSVANNGTVSVAYGSTVKVGVSYNKGDNKKCTITKADGTEINADKDPEDFTMPDQNVTIKAHSDAKCFVEGTLITLADGTVKPVEDLVAGDMILVFNHETGKIEASEFILNVFVEDSTAIYDVINLKFSNGAVVRIVSKHGFYDVTLNEYVYITEENAADFIGHEFYSVSQIDGKFAGDLIVLDSVEITTELVRACSPITKGALNCFAEGVLSVTAFPFDIEGFVNIFEYDENMKYDEESKQSDIEKYGLYTQDDFGGVIPAELFEAFNAQYLKVSVGKGYISEEEIMILLQFWINQGYI